MTKRRQVIILGAPREMGEEKRGIKRRSKVK